MKKIVTFGELMLRLTPPSFNRFGQSSVFTANFGGSEANVAVSLAGFGLRSEFVSCLPPNRIADSALEDLNRYGVQTPHVVRKKGRMGLYYMEEAAEADYVVIIDSGCISAEGSPLELKNKYTGDFITLYSADEAQVRALDVEYEKIRDAYRILVPNTAAATELIIAHPELFKDYEITKGKMDDVFLAVTGKRLSGGEEK